MSRKRTIIAGALAVLYPGLGHLYLREWIRAAAWFGIALVTALLVIPTSTVAAFEAGGLDALLGADLPLGAAIALFAVRVLNVLDAILLARRQPAPTVDEPRNTCPHCGGELDEELDFCPWCTTALSADAAPDQSTTEEK